MRDQEKWSSLRNELLFYINYIYLEYLDSDGDGINDADDEDDDNDGVDDDGRYHIWRI